MTALNQEQEVAAIAGRLTKAQQKVLVRQRLVGGESNRTFWCLHRAGLSEQASDGGVYNFRLTPLGLAVRARLQEQSAS